MKKVLAVVLCVCIALTLAVSVMAESSPETKVIGRKLSGLPEDTWTEVGEDDIVTVKANEKTYGKFNKWSIYVYTQDGEYKEAKEGVDYEIVEGSLTDKTLAFKAINRVAVAGNYNGTITDPAKVSSAPGKKPQSSKTGDFGVIYIAFAMLAASAVVFGAKKQLSK